MSISMPDPGWNLSVKVPTAEYPVHFLKLTKSKFAPSNNGELGVQWVSPYVKSILVRQSPKLTGRFELNFFGCHFPNFWFNTHPAENWFIFLARNSIKNESEAIMLKCDRDKELETVGAKKDCTSPRRPNSTEN
jgi:hypothetical protein